MCYKALIYMGWIRDTGSRSGIWKKPIPDPGSRGQKGTGSRIRYTAFFVNFSTAYLYAETFFEKDCLKVRRRQ
jgi:hypothetical protein